MIRTLLAASALALTLPVAIGQDDAATMTTAQIGPVVGATAPAFTATTSAGVSADLAAISGTNGAVIIFSRSLDWCPYCKKQAIELETIAAEMDTAGWPITLVTYDPTDTLAAFASDKDVTYTLLSDADSSMIDAFGLRNTEMKAGSRFDGIPHPAIVFISNDGTVRAVQREEGYKDRPPTAGLPQIVALMDASVPTE
jgi:peroxiredoxin Q/BCP